MPMSTHFEHKGVHVAVHVDLASTGRWIPTVMTRAGEGAPGVPLKLRVRNGFETEDEALAVAELYARDVIDGVANPDLVIDADPDLTADDYNLLQHLDATRILGQESASEKARAEKLRPYGVVKKDDHGMFRLTVKGKRLLRAR